HLLYRQDNQQDPPQGPRRHRPLDAPQNQTLEHTQHALDLGHNLVKVVPALAPQGQVYNLERVVPEERPLCMGPLASQDRSEQKRTKPDKNGKRVEARKSLKQLQ
nr:hypothetical protein [Tanacetum cinerariifolium]